MMSYRSAFKMINEDYHRYSCHFGGGKISKLLKVLIHERGFVYLLWLRLATVQSIIRPFFWLVYHHLSSKYGIQISTKTRIGPGLYIGHGCGVIINASATIGQNVSLSQFLTIGSRKGKAATIEDNVYIGPSVCLVEDVIIGHDSQIGAGSIVTKNIPPFSVAVGIPAKVIKRYNQNTKVWEKVNPQ